MESTLNDNYYNPKKRSSYGGVQRLTKSVKTPPKKVKDWLLTQDTYTLHKPVKRKFKRRRVIVYGINQQLQVDLIDVQNLKSYNDGTSFLLSIIDCFSKVAFVLPLKDKTGKSIVNAFTLFLNKRGPPLYIQSDQGQEFMNNKVQQLFKRHGIRFFTALNKEIKCGIVERFNKTIKQKIYRYLTKTNQRRFIDVLNDLVTSYNSSFNRSIGRSPREVDFQNQEAVWDSLYNKPNTVTKTSFMKGDTVRISKVKHTFEKGYLPSWTTEVFKVKKVLLKTRPITFILEDLNREELIGTFYEEELQKVVDSGIYKVENILKRRTRKGKKEVLVKWLGYPSSFNSWIAFKSLSKL